MCGDKELRWRREEVSVHQPQHQDQALSAQHHRSHLAVTVRNLHQINPFTSLDLIHLTWFM